MALWLPYLAAEQVLRRRHGRSWRSVPPAGRAPLLLSCQEGNVRRVAALDRRAEALGLRRGMGVADARALHPSVEVVERQPAAERKLLESLADWCDRYTPLVALDGEDGLFLDIAGCAGLFGGEEAMLDDLCGRLSRQGFMARAGLASTPGMAWAAARFALPAVAAGREVGVLAPLPLVALRLDPRLRARLENVGLRTVGALLEVPRAPLARRFGAALLDRLDQATGALEEAISPRRPVAPLAVERHLAEPVQTMEAVERLLASLAERLETDLERRQEGARFLELALFRVDGAVSRIGLGASRPLSEPAVLVRLFHERLEALREEIDAGCGFDLIRLSVLSACRFEARQRDLAGGAEGAEEVLSRFVDRLRARLGEAAVLEAVPVQSHVPERAAILAACPPTAAEPGAAAWAEGLAAPRPIRLLRFPEPVEAVVAEVPEGPPASFRWRRSLYRVAAAEGPERIAPEWWRSDAASGTRDYFRVEDEAGRRYWLYREGLYGEGGQPRWFLHGMFA